MEIKAETRAEQSIKDSIETIEVHTKKIEDSSKKMKSVAEKSVAEKAKQFTNSEAMNWLMGFKV